MSEKELIEKFKKSDREAEKIIAERIKNGDESALVILFDKHYPRIRWIVNKKVFNENDYEDIVNDISLEIIKAFKSGRYDAGKGNIAQFIWGIANNQIKSYLTKTKKDKQLKKDYKNMEAEKKLLREFEEEDKKRREKIIKLIKETILELDETSQEKETIPELDETSKKILYLNFYEKKDAKEIAKILNITQKQFYYLREKALKDLKDIIMKKLESQE